MKIFICEDDERQRENLVSIINNYIMIEEKPMEIEVATSDPYEVLEHAKELKDIIQSVISFSSLVIVN